MSRYTIQLRTGVSFVKGHRSGALLACVGGESGYSVNKSVLPIASLASQAICE